jgi:signal transduction histidine kinase
MKRFRKILVFFSNEYTLSFLACVFVAHLVLLFYFAQDYKHQRLAVIENKIKMVIRSINTDLPKDRQSTIDSYEDPDIKIQLVNHPAGEVSFRYVNDAQLARVLRGNLSNFDFSVMIVKGQWLRITSTITQHFFYREMMLFLIEIFVFGAIFISAWSVRRFTRPLEKFKSAADRLGVDLHSAPLDLYGPKAVRETACAMNQMQARIQDLIRDRTQMLAAISHDLRTPITRMKLRIQLLDDPRVEKLCCRDLDEMNEMIRAVLDFSRQDSNKADKTKIDFTSLLTTLCDDHADMGHDVTLQLNHSGRLPVLARSMDLKRALDNIINNACRYGTRANIVCSIKSKKIKLVIEDDGPGIPEDEIQRVFEPFYRADKSRNRDTGGVGLGLAVTSDIIKAHAGEITLSNIEPHGLRVTLKIPCAVS